jgi:hypothetical protein
VSPNQANEALTAAGYRLARRTPSEKGVFTLTVTQSKITHITNTAQMTLADIGQWLFRTETLAANNRTLVHNNTTRAVLLGLGYVTTKPVWWSLEHARDANLARLYCKGGVRTAVVHPRGTMFDRNRALNSVHSGYLTNGQLLALAAHVYEWANCYLNNEHETVPPSRLRELDNAPFCLNPGAHNAVESGAPGNSSNDSTSSSDTLDSGHVGHERRPPDFYLDAAMAAAPRKRRCAATTRPRQRGRSAPLASAEQRAEERTICASLQARKPSRRFASRQDVPNTTSQVASQGRNAVPARGGTSPQPAPASDPTTARHRTAPA